MPNKGQGISIRRQRNFGGVHVVGASVKRDGIFKKQTLEQRGRAASKDQRTT
jgi:hypothetical protein